MATTFKLDKYAYNPVYRHIRKYLQDPNIRYIFIRGGSSAGKTYSLTQALLNTQLEDDSRTMVMRKVSAEIRDTVFEDFKLLASKYDNHFKVHDLRVEGKRNEKIRFRGLDTPSKIKGLSTYKRLYLNEADSFLYGDFKELRRRLRGMAGQQIICDWNPSDANHWLKKEVLNKEEWVYLPNHVEGKVFSQLYSGGQDEDNSYVRINKAGDMVEIKTTYRDNYWVVGHPEEGYGFNDIHALAEFERMKENDPDDYNVYGNGNWGVRTERLVFKKWQEINSIPNTFKRIPSGLDFGFSPDPVALVDVYKGEYNGMQALLLDEQIYKTGLVIPNLNEGHPSLEKCLIDIEFDKRHLIVADYDKTDVNTLRILGYNVQLADRRPYCIVKGLNLMKGYVLLVTKRSVNLKNELDNYKYAVDRNGTILNEPMDSFNHLIDAARNVVFLKNRLWS